MAKGGNSPGLSRLAGLFKETAKNEAKDASPTVLDFGTINDDYSLSTDSFPIPIPKSDYLVSKRLKKWETAEDEEGHKHKIPEHGHHVPEHTHSIPEHTHTNTVSKVGLTTNEAGDHFHTNPEHGHTVPVGNTSLETNSDGTHKHSIAAHDHNQAVVAVALETADAGSHTHTINEHNHTASADPVTFNSNNAGEHNHTIDEHNHVVTIDNTEQNTNATEQDTEKVELETDEGGKHSHEFPDDWPLKVGDRVIVAWVNNDAVVLDVIIKATDIFD